MKKTEWIFGLHTVRAALDEAPHDVLEIWLQAGARGASLAGIEARAERAGVKVQWVRRIKLDKLVDNGLHQGVVLKRRATPLAGEAELWQHLEPLSDPLILILDGVTDPRNLGAALRSADCAGASAVVIPRDRAAQVTATARKAASGAVVPVFAVVNLARILKGLQDRGIWVTGTTPDAETIIFDADLHGARALVVGGEEHGLRRLTRSHCDVLVRIPMDGTVESLNVSAAAAICLFEVVRQRRSVSRD